MSQCGPKSKVGHPERIQTALKILRLLSSWLDNVLGDGLDYVCHMLDFAYCSALAFEHICFGSDVPYKIKCPVLVSL